MASLKLAVEGGDITVRLSAEMRQSDQGGGQVVPDGFVDWLLQREQSL